MPYGGGAGSGGGSGGGGLISSAAAAPLDSEGNIGDFHLRRDTGALTGPKYEGTINEDTHTQPNSGTVGTLSRNALKFTVAELVSIAGVGINFYEGSAGNAIFDILAAADRSILHTTPSVAVATGWVTQNFAAPINLEPGDYYIGCRGVISGDTPRPSNTDSGGSDFPGTKIVAPSTIQVLRWDTFATNYLDAPNNTYNGADPRMVARFLLDGVDTWQGADTFSMTVT